MKLTLKEPLGLHTLVGSTLFSPATGMTYKLLKISKDRKEIEVD